MKEQEMINGIPQVFVAYWNPPGLFVRNLDFSIVTWYCTKISKKAHFLNWTKELEIDYDIINKLNLTYPPWDTGNLQWLFLQFFSIISALSQFPALLSETIKLCLISHNNVPILHNELCIIWIATLWHFHVLHFTTLYFPFYLFIFGRDNKSSDLCTW